MFMEWLFKVAFILARQCCNAGTGCANIHMGLNDRHTREKTYDECVPTYLFRACGKIEVDDGVCRYRYSSLVRGSARELIRHTIT